MVKFKWTKKLTPIKNFFRKDFKVLLPQLYFLGLLLSVVLTLLFTIYPSLVSCSNFFGEEICTPTGLFIGIILSLPGYLIVGNVLPYLPAIPIGISFVLVLVLTAFLYSLLGRFIDKLRKLNKAKIKKANKITVFIIASFILLVVLFAALFLLSRIRGL